MKNTDIREGMTLQLKNDNPYGFGPRTVYVASLLYKGSYKTPWVISPTGEAFRPSDFAKAV